MKHKTEEAALVGRKITAVFLLLAVSLFPLFFGFRGYQGIMEAKFAAFCVLFGGYALAMPLSGVRLSPTGLWKTSSRVQRLVFLYMLLTWVSALLSPHFPRTLIGVSRYEGAVTISLYCLCFLFVSVYGRAGGRLLAVFAAAVTLFCLLSLAQLFGFNPFWLYPAGTNYHDAFVRYAGAFIGTIGNTDLASAFLCVAVPVCWISLLRLRDRRRFLLLIPLLLSLAILIGIRVSAGILGVFVGGLLSLPVVLPAKNRTRLLIFGCVVCLLLLITAALYLFDIGGGTLHEAHALLRGGADESFGSNRLHIWRAVWEKISERPLFGFGPDTMMEAGLEPFRRYDEALGETIVAHIDTAHNEYLNILFHQGLFALLSYLAALLLLAVRWVKRSPASDACAVLGGAALCYGIQAFFGIGMCLTAPFFWLSISLLDNAAR